jgi:hypothetical protein
MMTTVSLRQEGIEARMSENRREPDGPRAKPDRDLTADEGAARTVSTVVSPTAVRPKTTT